MSTEKRKSAKPAKILLVDDHPLVRERLTELINRESDLDVCGEAESASAALAAIAATKPDLAVIDLTLKDSHGLDLIKDIKLQHPGLRTLVFSMHDESLYAERVIRAGANGYINKQEATRKLIEAIRLVLAGQIYLSGAATTQLIQGVAGHARRDLKMDATRLTDRELQVFEMIGRGQSSRQIADHLGVGLKTIETYRARIQDKFGLHDAKELIQHAFSWVSAKRK